MRWWVGGWRQTGENLQRIKTGFATVYPALRPNTILVPSNDCIFSCPEQLNTWPCPFLCCLLCLTPLPALVGYNSLWVKHGLYKVITYQEPDLLQIATRHCWRIGIKKKRFFLGSLSQICLPTHPPQGFCKIWENERWNLDRKRRGVWRGLDLVWESATPPTHIWERYPQKKTFFLAAPVTIRFEFDFIF